ncbi:MAG: TolC family protein [Rikenellaceae bacterium]
MKLYIKIFVAIALFANTANAQTALTLQGYRDMVIKYNQQLKISNENISIAEDQLKMARTGYYPSLVGSAQANYLIDDQVKRFIGQELKDYGYDAKVTIQQNVYTGGAVRANVKAAKVGYSIMQESDKAVFQNVTYAADQTYWAFAAAAEQKDIAKQFVSIVSELYDVLKERYNQGYVSRLDLLMVETRLNEANIQYITANKYYQNAIRSLNTMLGNNTPIEFSVVDSLHNVCPVGEILAKSNPIESNPEYRAASLNVDYSKKNVNITKSKYNPQFVVGVQGVYGTPQMFNFTGNGSIYGVAFAQLNIPIFMWGQRRRDVSISKSGITTSEFELTDTRDRIEGDLNSAKINLVESNNEIDAATNNLSVASQTLDLNTFSYHEGQRTILDVLQSQLSWITAYTKFVNSHYNYKLAITEYNKAMGIYAEMYPEK